MKLKPTCILICTLLLFCSSAFAVHIKGGLITYEYLGSGRYKITVDVYRKCGTGGPNPSTLYIYDAATYAKQGQSSTGVTTYTALGNFSKTTFDPCISNKPTICYDIYRYTTTVDLPANANGYIIVASDANRIAGITNLINSSSTGITFTATIPGMINGVMYNENSSPDFSFTDTAVICYKSKFSYQFSASDKDNDVLRYSFGDGLNGTSNAIAPPYSSIPYASPYSGASPLGSTVTIDSIMGLISGIAPAQNGEYVIAVYVHEYRNGVHINSTRKELQISVADCSLVVASLKDYINCNSYTLTFENQTLANNIISYAWDFGVKNSTTDVSTAPRPNFTYADTGTYELKLTVVNSGGCVDSANSEVKVYPGFTPAFNFVGSCLASPFNFSDISFAKYGTINSWYWDLGDSSATSIDTFKTAMVSYNYSGAQNTVALLRVTSSVGCSGSISKTVAVNEVAYLFHPFKDTLICSIDSLPLNAKANGSFEWSPNKYISDVHVLNPIVYPKDTTVYTLTIHDRGCTDSLKVKVNVLKFITVKLAPDSGICQTDSFTLRPVTEALSFKWVESNGSSSLSNALVKHPVAKPLTTTTYYVTANLGFCQDSAKITINVAPYPILNLGNDTVICYGNRLVLNPSVKADLFSWTSSSSLVNTNSIHAVAGPVKTSMYILTVHDTSYCRNLVTDTINVRVVPAFSVYAGKDTSVTVNQPLQMMVTAPANAYTYKWIPSTNLSNDAISNPVGNFTTSSADSTKYTVLVKTPEGCVATDDIVVHVFKNGADIYVPSGFTPNGDGLNDILKPVLSGISGFDYFKVYNRLGQMVFSTTQLNTGWDGLFNGAAQPNDTYVYVAQGKSFDGQTVLRKGTVVLIR